MNYPVHVLMSVSMTAIGRFLLAPRSFSLPARDSAPMQALPSAEDGTLVGNADDCWLRRRLARVGVGPTSLASEFRARVGRAK